MLRHGSVAVGCIVLFGVVAAAQTTVTTSGGTANTVPLYTGSSALGNSVITQSGSNIGIGTTSPTQLLQIDNGNITLWTHNYSYPVGAGTYFGAKISFSQWSNAPGSQGSAEIGSIANTAWSHGWLPSSGLYFSTSQQDSLPEVRMVIDNNGNLGIGTAAPSTRLEVDGNIKLTSGSGASITFADGTVQSTAYTGVSCGGDFAESVDVTGKRKQFEPGDVLAIDPSHPGKFVESSTPYSTSVLGVYSTKPGFVGRRLTGPKSRDEVPMAMVGIVPTKVSAENGPIHPGDLLVSSSTPGYAMKGTDRSRMLGAVVGKALGNLDSGTGVIEAGITLQ